MAEYRLTDTRRLVRQAEAVRARLMRRWISRGLRKLRATLNRLGAEAELRAMDERELHDLGLDRGGIAHAARWGRLEG